MKKKYYILIAIFAYSVFLLTTIPARFAGSLITANTGFDMQGISGSLWQGSAYLISIDNSIQLKDTTWSFKAWKLLLGQAAADISTTYSGNRLQTELGSSFSGRYFVSNLTGVIMAQDIAQLANIPLAQFSGTISLDITAAQWKAGEQPAATGQILWKDAVITVADSASLGNVSFMLTESPQQLLNAEIKNQGGDIRITGTAELLTDAGYSLDMALMPTATANNNIRQSLAMFAKKQPNGEYHLRKSGTLTQSGLM